MDADGPPLLTTKLNRPLATGDLIERPRLNELLNHSLQQGPLTVVSASAGFGKSTLVSAWIKRLMESDPPVQAAWLSLDKSDSDLVVFLRYVVAAIRTVFPESCPETLTLLQGSERAALMPLVIALSNDIEQLPARVVLVLDDYHAIRDNVVHDFLSELLRHWPQHLHLVLISRRSPPLPLGKLRGQGQVTEIRTRDLRFTPEESAAFLNRVLASSLSPSTIAFLDERLEGWIAGLRLATLSLSSGANAEDGLKELSGTQFEIADYLMDEVLAYQTPVILRFLLVTSLLNRFCVPLCESVLSADNEVLPGDAAACIQWLEQNNLFVIPLDTNGQWYRYHHLFQELLQRRLAAVADPERVAKIHRSAAAWFAEQGLVDEALHHALAIHDLGLAAQLMVAGLCDALNRDDRSTLERWLRLLPDDFIDGHPWLLMIKALVFQISWQPAAVWKLLDHIEALLDEEGESVPYAGELQDLPVLRGMIAALRAQQAFGDNQAERAVAYAEQALALFPKRWSFLRGGAIIYWGFGMRALGRGDVAHRALIDEYESLLEKSDAYSLRILFTASFNAIESGDLEQARLLALAMLDHASSRQMKLTTGHAHYLLGVLHYCWNELDAAEQHFDELVTKRLSVFTQVARNGMIGLARVFLARTEFSAAWRFLDLLSQLDMGRLGEDGEDARSLRAQLAYCQGDAELAFRWADGYTAPVVGRSLLWLQDPHLARARILLDRGTDADVRTALDILDPLQSFAESTFSVRSQIEVLVLRALALQKQEKSADAFAALRRAVELARPGGFIRVFVDLGSPMQSMLQSLVLQDFAVPTVRRILAAFPGRPPEASKVGETDRLWPGIHRANSKMPEPLTSRELEILSLLRERLSNKEIALRLHLSPLTVKRYTNGIYGKLGVNRRWDAVIKAEDLGFFPAS